MIFPNRAGKAIERRQPRKLLARLGIEGTTHGMRSAFRNWAAETGVRREVAERCLNHTVRSKTEAAYLRTTLFDNRREVTETWGRHVAS